MRNKDDPEAQSVQNCPIAASVKVPTSFEVRIQRSAIQRVLLSPEKYRFNIHLQSACFLSSRSVRFLLHTFYHEDLNVGRRLCRHHHHRPFG